MVLGDRMPQLLFRRSRDSSRVRFCKSLDEFESRLRQITRGYVANLDYKRRGLVIAGGSVLRALCVEHAGSGEYDDTVWQGSDVDFYLTSGQGSAGEQINVDSEEAEQQALNAKRALLAIFAMWSELSKKARVTIYRSTLTLTMVCADKRKPADLLEEEPTVAIQLLTRVVDNIESTVGRFDVACTQLYYDG